MGDYEQDAPWSTDSLRGCKRFIDKVIRLKDKVNENSGYSKELESLIHKSIKKVENDLCNMAYNTAVSTLMILTNAYLEKESITKDDYHVLLTLLNPIAPHITEELNEEIGFEPICKSTWPIYDEEKTVDNEITIAVQVNGKVRGTITIAKDEKEDIVKEKALNEENVKRHIDGLNIVKIIVVPNKIVNIIAK
jgi:leucyl-tRNA synthetase